MQYVLVMNLVLTMGLALVWSSNTWTNFFIRFILIGAMVFNAVAVFQQFGYMVKV